MGERVVSVEEVAQVKQVAMHVDKPRERRVSREVDPLRVRRDVDRAGRSDRGDVAASYDNRLVLLRRRSSAVDDRGMFKSNDWRRYTDEILPSNKRLRRHIVKQLLHLPETAVPAAFILPARFFVSKTALSQYKVCSSSMRGKLDGDVSVSWRARERAILVPSPVEDKLFRRTHLAKRSVQIVQFIASDESQVEIASGTGGNRRSLSPTGVFGRQEPLSYGLRISPQAEHFVTRRGEASFNVQRST